MTSIEPVSQLADHLNPTFIVGCGSSGTHLLASILDGHSQVACGPELWVFNHKAFFKPFQEVRANMDGWLKKGLVTDWPLSLRTFFRHAESYGHTPASILELARNCETHRHFIDKFFQSFLARRRKLVWVEKTLSNYRCLDQLLEIYPEAQIIHMARNGLDTLVSLAKRGVDASQCATRWLFDNAAVLAWRDDPRYILLRYEDLVRNTETEIRRVCRHLRIGFEIPMLDGSNQESQEYWRQFANGNYHKTWNSHPSAGIMDSSIGRHVHELPVESEAVFWSVRLTKYAQKALGANVCSAAEVMSLLGYPDAPQRKVPQVALAARARFLSSFAHRTLNDFWYFRRFHRPCTFLASSTVTVMPEGAGARVTI